MRLLTLPAALCLVTSLLGFGQVQAESDPIKVFILAGQSNMVGYGKTLNGRNPDFDAHQKPSATNPGEIPGGIGCLAWAVKTMPDKYGFGGTNALVNAHGEWLVRDDVNVYARMEVFKDKDHPEKLTEGVTRKGPHTVGFGKANSKTQIWNGPEFGFGHVVGNALDQDVLIIKVATGGTSLHADWRSPTAVKKRGGEVGFMWGHMLGTVKNVLDNLDTEFPVYKGRRVELAGFGWHQGWNDGGDQAMVDQYQANMADFITDVRVQYGANLRFVIANTGIGGKELTSERRLAIIAAQNAMEAIDNVAVVETRGMWREAEVSPSGFNYHWNHNGITYYEIGAGMGEAMVAPSVSKLD